MSELYAPPDIEPAVVAVLSVDDWWVGTEYEDNPAGSIRVSATGGARPVDRVVTAQTVLVECWHDDEAQAWRIAQTAWARLAAAAGSTVAGVDIKHISSTMPNNHPDVNRIRLVRYQFLAEVWSRLVPLEAT